MKYRGTTNHHFRKPPCLYGVTMSKALIYSKHSDVTSRKNHIYIYIYICVCDKKRMIYSIIYM